MARVVVVTGGTGAVGSDLAHQLVEAGYLVSFTYNSDTVGAEKLLTELRAVHPASTAYQVNVADPEGVAEYGMFLAERYGEIFGLVNNAGINSNSDPLVDIPVDAWNQIISVNLTGTFLVCKAVVPLLTKGGRVVNISSIYGRNTMANRAAYGASKHGVLGITQALAKELGSDGITVNSICPGGISSAMQERMWGKTAVQRGETFEEFRSFKLSQIPLGRICDPADVSATVLFLLSEGGAFITGAAIDLNGGAR